SSAARAAGQLERARIGQERAAKLESGLVRLTIVVAPEDAQIPGFSLKRSTETVPPALWGSPVPVDPGEYTIEASAPGYETFSRKVTVGKESVSTDVPRLAQASAPPPNGSAVSNGPPPVPLINTVPPPAPAPAPEADQRSALSGMQIAGIVVAGAGVVSLAVGTVFGVEAISKNDDAKKYCQGKVCNDQRGVTLTNDANSAAVVANVTVGLGAAALVGGGLLYFL